MRKGKLKIMVPQPRLAEIGHPVKPHKVDGESLTRIWPASIVLVLFLLSGVCLAQSPAPMINIPANEVSVESVVAGKGPGVNFGFGGQISGSHFLSEHIGIKLEGDYTRADDFNLHDGGLRGGAILRFRAQHAIQPYLECLAGYARVEASYLRPAARFHGSGSVLGGGGFDLSLGDGWYATAGVDIQQDWTVSTTLARGVLGVSYRFGVQ
jgi:hypothetical protein